jgi:hypothetical protein
MSLISDQLCAFLDQPLWAWAGTRDENLVPRVHRVFGWRVGADRETLTLLIPEVFTEKLFTSLEDNGQVAFTAGHAISHETYQFKGTSIQTRPSDEADRELFEAYLAKMLGLMSSLGFSPNQVEPAILRPCTTLDFKVREIFIQTPGPEAGTSIAAQEPSWT